MLYPKPLKSELGSKSTHQKHRGPEKLEIDQDLGEHRTQMGMTLQLGPEN